METYLQLMEQARELGIVRSPSVKQYLEWREDSVVAQSEPLDVYIAKMRFFNQNINRAVGREHGWDVYIDEMDCYLQGYSQNWRCALTGDLLEFRRGGHDFNGQWANPFGCTNDRIDPSKHYTIENLQMVTWQANLFKQGFSMHQLKSLVTKTAKTLQLTLT